MRKLLSLSKFGAAVVAAVVLVPSVALATHVFEDVPDDAFYADPVEWAADNEITTGKSATSFAPLDNVTRGESVTFLQRLEDNVLAPRDAAQQAEIDALEAQLANIGSTGTSVLDFGSGVDIDTTTPTFVDSVTITATGPVDVVVNAHVAVGRSSGSEGRYNVELRIGDCTGDRVGRGYWRAATTTSTFATVSVPVTAHIADFEGDTIALCASKALGSSADVDADMWAMTASWS